MNQLIDNQKAEMTSREIADLVGARHDSVKRTIERLSSGVISEPPLVDGAKPPMVSWLNSCSARVE